VILFGGGSKNRVWQKIMANILGRDILVSENPETAVYGAAFLAGINPGISSSIPPGKKRIIKYNRALSRSYDLLYKRYREIEEGLVALPQRGR
jgi:xylulokinase